MIRNVSSVEHYTWGEACDGWRLLAGPDLAVIQERMPAGTREVRHRHEHARQLFYVLTGRLRIALRAATHDLAGGDACEVPPGEPHQVLNASDQEVTFLVISAPSTRGDRIDLDK